MASCADVRMSKAVFASDGDRHSPAASRETDTKEEERLGRVCCVRAGYHAVLAVKDACADSGAACGGLRSLTAALPREAPCAGNPAPGKPPGATVMSDSNLKSTTVSRTRSRGSRASAVAT